MIVDEVESWKAADAKEVAAYLASPAPATVLALVAAELKADSALAKAVAKAGQVLDYDVPKRELPDWVAEQFERSARRPTRRVPRAGRASSATTSTSCRQRDREARDVGGRRADHARLTSSRSRRARAETAIFVADRRVGETRRRGGPRVGGGDLLERPRLGRADAAHRLAREPRRRACDACQRLADEGVRARDAAPKLKMHPFAAEKAFAQARELLARTSSETRSSGSPSSTRARRAARGCRPISSSSARSST